MSSIFVVKKGLVCIQYNIALRTLIGKCVREMSSLNVVSQISWVVGFKTETQSTTFRPVGTSSNILIEIFELEDRSYKIRANQNPESQLYFTQMSMKLNLNHFMSSAFMIFVCFVSPQDNVAFGTLICECIGKMPCFNMVSEITRIPGLIAVAQSTTFGTFLTSFNKLIKILKLQDGSLKRESMNKTAQDLNIY